MSDEDSIEDLKRDPVAAEIERATHVSVIFDAQLNYVIVSEGVCNELKKSREELVGKNIVDLYPEIIESSNYRNLIKAIKGHSVKGTITGRDNAIFNVTYKPIFSNGTVMGIHVEALKK